MRRRGKGEASFLHCKSARREEADVTNRGREMEGDKEAKKRQNGGKKIGERRAEVNTDVAQTKVWERGRQETGKEI